MAGCRSALRGADRAALPVPRRTPGLFVGCLIANLLSPMACWTWWPVPPPPSAFRLWTQSLRNRWLAPLPPVVCNAVIVGAVIAFAEGGTGGAFWTAYAFNAFTVGLGELIASAVLGQLLLGVLPRVSFFREMIPADKLDRLGLKTRVSVRADRCCRARGRPDKWSLAPPFSFWVTFIVWS